MKKILFLLLTTEKYKDRQTNILEGWSEGEDVYFYSEHEDLQNKVIKVCDNNDVEEKQVSVFKKIQELFYNDYEWFFFGDDDTFVNVNLLKKELNNLETDRVHGSDIFGCWGDLHYPSGGAGFLIHNNLISNFFESKVYNVNYSDVTFGLNMRDKNILIKNNKKFHSQNYKYYNIDMADVYKYITFHYINNIEEMKKLHEICQKNTTI